MKNIFVVAVVVGLLVHFGVLKNPFESETEFVEGYDGRVVLYATTWCGYCQKTRELLGRNNVEYIEYDIEKSLKGKHDFDKLNGRGIPLLIVNGHIVRGYNPQKIIQLVKEG